MQAIGTYASGCGMFMAIGTLSSQLSLPLPSVLCYDLP